MKRLFLDINLWSQTHTSNNIQEEKLILFVFFLFLKQGSFYRTFVEVVQQLFQEPSSSFFRSNFKYSPIN